MALLGGLRHCITAGEPLPASLARRVREALPGLQLWNNYGCTEIHDITYHKVCNLDLKKTCRNYIPAGRPIDNSSVFIVDGQRRRLPVGVMGEICVAGAGVSLGYFGQTGLTAEKFIGNPFPGSGPTLYLTGDVGRIVENGTIEHLGRRDFDIKIRGFRVDVQQVEEALLAQPEVAQAIVTGWQEGNTAKQLVAYIIPVKGRSFTISSLWERLKEFLPLSMIPSLYVELKTFPKLPNGKLDRRSLPAPRGTASRMAYVTPEGDIEQQLAVFWTELLKLECISALDNFFTLGGHSLLAMQLISRLEKAFSIKLTLQAIFEVATLRQMAATIDGLINSKKSDSDALIVVPQGKMEKPNLSFQQDGLWFIDNYENGLNAYNVQSSLKLTGELNVDALRNALKEIFYRHDSLRTNIITDDDVLYQIVKDNLEVELELVDISLLNSVQRNYELERILKEDAGKKFNLSSDLLFRTKIISLNGTENILSFTMHHIITDGWSGKIILKELAFFYNSFNKGTGSQLPYPKFSYTDYSICHRKWVQHFIRKKQLDYWDGKLSGYNKLAMLPTDYKRPKNKTYNGCKFPFSLSERTRVGLVKLSEHQKSTLFITLMSAIHLFLVRFTGESDISVGTVVLNRHNLDVENIVGCFINTLVIRNENNINSSFIDLLSEIKSAVFEAFDNQDAPFQLVVERVEKERHLNQSPIFQVMFILQDIENYSNMFDGLQASNVFVDSGTSKYDLTIEMHNSEEQLSGWFEYNTDLFTKLTINNMVESFVRVLDEILNDPRLPVSNYNLLNDKQINCLLNYFNSTAVSYDQDKKVIDLFESIVDSAPNSIAVTCQDRSITNKELSILSSKIACYLLTSEKYLENKVVAVYLEKDIELIACILGIMKAGGAYLPLDVNYPIGRILYFVEDVAASMIITKKSWSDNLKSSSTTKVFLDSEDFSEKIISFSPNHLNEIEIKHKSDDLAYIIYTSGSTGKPKGVQCKHKGLTNFIYSMQSEFKLNNEDALLSVTPCSFDISILEFFLPLCFGAKLVLLPHDLSYSGSDISNEIKNQSITIVQATPATWELIENAWPEINYNLKVLCGGEALSRGLASRLLSRNVTLWNLYGPTEATVWCTAHKISTISDILPIGKPLANTRMYVLDQNLNLLPIGVKGDLYVSGVGLSIGYLNNEEITKQVFINNPFHTKGDDDNYKILYKTGDKARWLMDGSLECHGRSDHQLKIRGFRIEPGEIESQLLNLGLFKEVLVTDANGPDNNKLLVAYYCPIDLTQEITISQLRDRLLAQLPAYMVPGLYVPLDALPRLPNGKLDRRSLPAPQTTASRMGYVAPRSETERRLAGLWEEVLQLEGVSADDDFFNLGGHSLLATQLVSRVRNAFGAELSLQAVFEAATLSRMAARIDAAAGVRAVRFNPPPRGTHLPLSFQQERLWFAHEHMAGQQTAGNMLLTFPLAADTCPAALRTAFNSVVARHEALRTTFFTDPQGRPAQRIAGALD
ncbi:non-ribosomal peptide synthetase, partial [Photorhabdus heterorhabditis]|uniref:non-ribosomal peptide synthetase n=1 Tax=Photorhabdus heterorhabditis TaxID=880156 RepID=UPI001562ADCD|nr:amino acid adenylation domain-containing protein [Photorhabdus heterorhabditis subsp. aluminescens]